MEDAPAYTADALDYALSDSKWPDDRETALLLFDHLTEPHAVADNSYHGGLQGLRLGLRGKPHWLAQAWNHIFLPNLAEAAPDLISIIDRNLRRAHLLQTSTGTVTGHWDPISYGRSAIEPHPQDSIPDAIDVVIDAARDCLEALLDLGGPYGVALLESWAESDQPLLQRLALHGWVNRSDVEPNAKIEWLLSRGWLWTTHLHHESFRLIATALPGATAELTQSFIEEVEVGDTTQPNLELRAYGAFNLLFWIGEHLPGLDRVEQALDRIRISYPGFRANSHPDFLTWHSGGPVASRSPMTPEQIHEGIVEDASDVIAQLRAFEDVDFSMDGASWQGVVNVLTQVVREHPRDGLTILTDPSSHTPKFMSAVVWGWMDAAVGDEMVQEIVAQLQEIDLAPTVFELARLLADGDHGSSGVNTSWHRSEGAREMAVTLWNLIDPSDTGNTISGTWLDRAINHPAGKIALFWVRAIAAEWKADADNWEGIPDAIRIQLDFLLAGDDLRTTMAQVMVASQVLFFFAADEGWTTTHVLTLFDWDVPERAVRNWESYLTWGRWNEKLLASGLREKYETTLDHLNEMTEDSRKRFCSHLAGIAVYSETAPLPLVEAFTAKAIPVDRVEWIDEVSRQLDEISAGAVEDLWARWMRDYWTLRNQSVPNSLTLEEAGGLALWVVYLTNSVEEGIELAFGHDGLIGEPSELLRVLDSDRFNRAPALYARLISHLLRGNHAPFYGDYHLRQIVGRLTINGFDDEIAPIVEQAVRLQIPDAQGW
jgi:hypothetical protein